MYVLGRERRLTVSSREGLGSLKRDERGAVAVCRGGGGGGGEVVATGTAQVFAAEITRVRLPGLGERRREEERNGVSVRLEDL